MASQGMIGYKADIQYGDGATPEVFTSVFEVTSIDPSNPQFDEVEFTHLQSPNRTREFKPTFIDMGELACEANFVPSDPTHQQIFTDRASGIVRNWRYRIKDNISAAVLRTATFPGYVKSAKEGPVTTTDKIALTFSVRISGAVTYS